MNRASSPGPIRRCVHCVMPDTRPGLTFDDAGICAACRAYEARAEVDWAGRARALGTLLRDLRPPSGEWDCLVPVSGGKDSTFQVVRLLEMGVRPLCVTVTACDPTPLGLANLENLRRLGVDHVAFTPDPLLRARLNRAGLIEVGDIGWAEHLAIFATVLRSAIRFRVPLIIWGENPHDEYGGRRSTAASAVFHREIADGLLLGLTPGAVAERYDIPLASLAPYEIPSEAELAAAGVQSLFLGHFLPWDGLANAAVAAAHGFVSHSDPVEGSLADYENLDNYQAGIHDYFKFLKYGYGRVSDLASLHVRRGRMTRAEALAAVRGREGRFPSTYLGKPLADILAPLAMKVGEFIDICDRYTNRALFETNADGSLAKDGDGNLRRAYVPE